MTRQDYKVLIPAFLVYIAYILLTLPHPFFWDTIQLASEHALWFYNHGFGSLLLPDHLDSGHIPFTGIYLALAWKLFGWNLATSHLVMLPWVLGIVYQAWLLIKKLIPAPWQVFSFLILLADPTLMTQMGLVSPDVFLIFFFLLSINAILSKKHVWLSLALTGLVLASLRGMMIAAALFLFALLFGNGKISFHGLVRKLLHTIPAWLPAGLTAAAYLGYHYYEKGWVGYHAGSPWAESFSLVSLTGFLRNSAILGWRMLDFGRIFLWLATLWFWLRLKKQANPLSGHAGQMLGLWSFLFIFLVPSLLIHKGLVNHRYLLPLFIVMSLFMLVLFSKISLSVLHKKLLAALLILALLAGNLWRYPAGIATGWDSTLAHWPYYGIRADLHHFLLEKQITPSDVGSEFPELAGFECTSPGAGRMSFVPIDTLTNRYIFWSNVMNGFPENVQSHLEQHWEKAQVWESFGIRAMLYQNPRY